MYSAPLVLGAPGSLHCWFGCIHAACWRINDRNAPQTATPTRRNYTQVQPPNTSVRSPLALSLAVNEPGVQFECDACACDLTHTIRIKCADPACQSEDGVDICPPCFCAGKEFRNHLRSHAYRVIVRHHYHRAALLIRCALRNSTRIQYSPPTGGPTSQSCSRVIL